MKVFTIAGGELRRFLRTPVTLILGFVLPLLFVLIVGQGASRTKPSVGLVVEGEGPLATMLAESIRSIDELRVFDLDRQDMFDELNRSDIAAGAVVPAGYDEALRSGRSIDVEYYSATVAEGDLSRLIEAEVVALSAQVEAASFASTETGAELDEALAATELVAAIMPGTDVIIVGPGGSEPDAPVGPYEGPAASIVLQFVFITAIASSAMIIESRQLGVGRRMLSTPTRAGTIIAGAALGRFLISAVQALIIVAVSVIVFGVDWGSPPAALAVLALFALIGAGAGLLTGSIFSGEAMAYGVGIGLGIALSIVVSIDSVKALSPNRWALDALEELMRRGGSIGDILPELGVLALFAAVLLVLSTWRFQKAITP